MDLSTSPYVLHIERDPPSPGMLRVHYRGGLVMDVPAVDPVESEEEMAYRRERARRESAYESMYMTPSSSAVAVRCGCWHRTDGTHASDCPCADVGDFLPPHREIKTGDRVKRGDRWVDKTELKPPVVREPVSVSAEPAPRVEIISTEPELVCVLDTETTGLAHEGGRITEIAAVVANLTTSRIVRKLERLINPGVPVPAHITRLTGITDEMLKGAPTFMDAWPEFVAFVADVPDMPVIAHNAQFDRGMLASDLERCGALSDEWPRWRWYCSKSIAGRVIPGLASYSLSGRGDKPGLREILKLGTAPAHRALGDAMTTCALLRVLRERAAKPWREWRGDAHVWGVGAQKELAPKAVKAPPVVPVTAVTVEASSVPVAPPVISAAPGGAPSKARPRTVKALPREAVVRDLFAAGGSR